MSMLDPSSVRLTRSASRSLANTPEPKKTDVKTRRSVRQEILVIESDSDSESSNNSTYRNKKAVISRNKATPQKQKVIKSDKPIKKVFKKTIETKKQLPILNDEVTSHNINDELQISVINGDHQTSVINNEHQSSVINRELQTSAINNQNQPILPLSPLKTPRKNKSLSSEADWAKFGSVTPPKQKKIENNENTLFSPSSLFRKLDLNSPPPSSDQNDAYFEPKKLFEQPTNYQSARKALHSTVPVQMPGREKEHAELRVFIKEHLENQTSGTLYVSGPPGTGKTASLSTILQQPDIKTEFKEVYVNCTAIKSSGSIYSRIVKELGLKCSGKTEKDYTATIDSHLSKNHKMILLVLDEIDQLESKKQSVLYTIFEWPSRPKSRIILIGIANALDLTDRILPRLQARCELKPKLMHFAPYSKQQIVEIFTSRLKAAGVLDLFSPVALQMLAGKVAAISGDVRRALDIGRRVVEIVEQHKKEEALKAIDGNAGDNKPKAVDLKHVVGVLNSVYGTSNNLNDDNEDCFPLQQKIIVCSLLLILKKARNKDVTVGKLHDVYRKVCGKRNIMAVDQAEFVGLCSLIETKGIIRVSGKKEPRLHKINLEWDNEEVAAALKDKQLMSVILQDDTVLGKM